MRQILVIAKKEFGSYFDSLIAYMVIALFLGLSGFFTWFYGADVFLSGQASLRQFFAISMWTTFVFVPALTMRLFAEENKTGTIELLLTKAVSNWQVILGKFFAVLSLVAIALVCSLPYYFTVAWLGPIDHGSVWCGYLGIILLAASLAGIGIFVSSITNNQIVALLITYVIALLFIFIFQTLAGNIKGFFGTLFDYLSVNNHYQSIARGVIDTRDVIYFLSIAFVGLFAAEYVLSKRNATD